MKISLVRFAGSGKFEVRLRLEVGLCPSLFGSGRHLNKGLGDY